MAKIRIISKTLRVVLDEVLSTKYSLAARAVEDNHIEQMAAKARREVINTTYRNGKAMAIYRSIVIAAKFATEAYIKMDATITRCSRLQWKISLQKSDAGK